MSDMIFILALGVALVSTFSKENWSGIINSVLFVFFFSLFTVT